jgi:hypothetical protein
MWVGRCCVASSPRPRSRSSRCAVRARQDEALSEGLEGCLRPLHDLSLWRWIDRPANTGDETERIHESRQLLNPLRPVHRAQPDGRRELSFRRGEELHEVGFRLPSLVASIQVNVG